MPFALRPLPGGQPPAWSSPPRQVHREGGLGAVGQGGMQTVLRGPEKPQLPGCWEEVAEVPEERRGCGLCSGTAQAPGSGPSCLTRFQLRHVFRSECGLGAVTGPQHPPRSASEGLRCDSALPASPAPGPPLSLRISLPHSHLSPPPPPVSPLAPEGQPRSDLSNSSSSSLPLCP